MVSQAKAFERCFASHFLMRAVGRLEFPPMSKKHRLMVHKLANLYRLKSKSYGTGLWTNSSLFPQALFPISYCFNSGRQRFPTLIKTVYSCYPPQPELLNFLNRSAAVPLLKQYPLIPLFFLTITLVLLAQSQASQITVPVHREKPRSKEEKKKMRKMKNMNKWSRVCC